jgi:hypothetical protein
MWGFLLFIEQSTRLVERVVKFHQQMEHCGVCVCVGVLCGCVCVYVYEYVSEHKISVNASEELQYSMPIYRANRTSGERKARVITENRIGKMFAAKDGQMNWRYENFLSVPFDIKFNGQSPPTKLTLGTWIGRCVNESSRSSAKVTDLRTVTTTILWRRDAVRWAPNA